MKGKHNWKENNIEQKRKQKKTEGTEKKQFFKFQAQWTKTEKRDERKMSDDGYSICLHIQQDLYWGKYLKGR